MGLLRPRRPVYEGARIGRYNYADATACKLLMQTSLRGSTFCAHFDFVKTVVLLSDQGFLELSDVGEEGTRCMWRDVERIEMKKVLMEEPGGKESLCFVVFVELRREKGGEREALDCGLVSREGGEEAVYSMMSAMLQFIQ